MQVLISLGLFDENDHTTSRHEDIVREADEPEGVVEGVPRSRIDSALAFESIGDLRSMGIRMSFLFRLFFLGGCALLMASSPATATIEWIAIGDAGNLDSSEPIGPLGGVAYEYSISKYETTKAEYTAFLNAKAASDPLGLYNPNMESDLHGGIVRSGTPGSYTYAVKDGFANEAVSFVTFFDVVRFANWMENGEGNGDTESGSYTLLGGTETPSNVATFGRNPGAEIVVPSHDEWFKASYYDAPLEIYYDYPMGTDDVPTCTSPKPTPNTANCGNSNIRGITDVGAYEASASPYGTFDQGGNVMEWLETSTSAGTRRIVRGGGWTGLTQPLKATGAGTFPATNALNYLGFRLARLVGGIGGDPLDITEITLTKRIERFDGMPYGDPYFFEACVAGTGIEYAEVSPPGEFPIPLMPDGPGHGRYCQMLNFTDSAALDLAFPNGMYAFYIEGAADEDSKTLDLQATEPGGYLDLLSPVDEGSVPDDQDLNLIWALAEKSNGVGCIAGMSCADEIFVGIEEFSGMGFAMIVDERLPMAATDLLIPSSDLFAGHFYDGWIGTSTGTANFDDQTDEGDPVDTFAGYEDINRFSFEAVPEPTAVLLGAVALLTLAVVSRGRVERS